VAFHSQKPSIITLLKTYQSKQICNITILYLHDPLNIEHYELSFQHTFQTRIIATTRLARNLSWQPKINCFSVMDRKILPNGRILSIWTEMFFDKFHMGKGVRN
jgi:hypothetical protein